MFTVPTVACTSSDTKHFECGVWMYRTRAVLQVKEDALKTFAESHEVTLEEFQKKSFLVRTFMGELKLFEPLL